MNGYSHKIIAVNVSRKRILVVEVIILLLLLFVNGNLIAQQTPNVSFGINYNFKQINIEKISQSEYFIFNDQKSDDYDWSQEDIDDYNQSEFINTIHQISADVFSGLTGNDSTKLRIGFGIGAGLFKFSERVFLEEDFVNNSNSGWNLFGEGMIYAQYRFTDKIYFTERLNVSYYSNDMNDVKISKEDLDNKDHYTVTYNNLLTTIEYGSTTNIVYKWKSFDFMAGPQFMFYQSECDYSQHFVFNSSGDVLIDNISCKTENKYAFRLSTGINYRVNNKISSYLNISFWNDIEIKLGIRI